VSISRQNAQTKHDSEAVITNQWMKESYMADFVTCWTKNRAMMQPVICGNWNVELVASVEALLCGTTVQDNSESWCWWTAILQTTQIML